MNSEYKLGEVSLGKKGFVDSHSPENLPKSLLKDVLSDLKEANDIEGAVLVDGKDIIVACDLPANAQYEAEIPKILERIEELGGFALNENSKYMFSHCIFDYDGCKILAKRLRNLTLLVMLQKQGYIGLAMLDIENSIRRIDEILNRTDPHAIKIT